MDRPAEVDQDAWMQMDDRERSRILDLISLRWYRDIGQHLSDAAWVRGMTTGKWAE